MSTKSIEDRRAEVLARQEEVRAGLEDLRERRRALAPEVADGDRGAEKKAAELARQVAEARERLALFEDVLEELGRREDAERAAAEKERLEGLRVEYDDQADRRAELEERAQEALERLASVVEELEAVDVEQRHLSTQIGDRLNESRISTEFVVGNWLESRLAHHLPGTAAKPAFLKPLTELNPLERRAPRPSELEAAQRENQRTFDEARRAGEAEREALELAERIRGDYDRLMTQASPASAAPEDSDRHEREFVLPTLEHQYGWETIKQALDLKPERTAAATNPEEGEASSAENKDHN